MPTSGAPILRTDDLSVTYGGLRAVDHVTMTVEQGALVGLIGPNGAGKTTLIDALTGFTPASSGRITFDGTDITRLSAHKRARRGLTRTFQSLELFNDLTVLENLQVAAERPTWWQAVAGLARPERDRGTVLASVLDRLQIGHLREKLPAELSQGQRKLVGVARAMAADPKLLLLDEPAAGLDTPESQELGQLLRSMVISGATMLLVDHDMRLVLDVCDVIYVLEFGKVIARGTPAEIRRDPRVIAAYLGEAEAARHERRREPRGDAARVASADGTSRSSQ